jgi:hypothetical protein
VASRWGSRRRAAKIVACDIGASLQGAGTDAGPAQQVVVYPDAGHGFHCDERRSYHEASAKAAWPLHRLPEASKEVADSDIGALAPSGTDA